MCEHMKTSATKNWANEDEAKEWAVNLKHIRIKIDRVTISKREQKFHAVINS